MLWERWRRFEARTHTHTHTYTLIIIIIIKQKQKVNVRCETLNIAIFIIIEEAWTTCCCHTYNTATHCEDIGALGNCNSNNNNNNDSNSNWHDTWARDHILPCCLCLLVFTGSMFFFLNFPFYCSHWNQWSRIGDIQNQNNFFVFFFGKATFILIYYNTMLLLNFSSTLYIYIYI